MYSTLEGVEVTTFASHGRSRSPWPSVWNIDKWIAWCSDRSNRSISLTVFTRDQEGTRCRLMFLILALFSIYLSRFNVTNQLKILKIACFVESLLRNPLSRWLPVFLSFFPLCPSMLSPRLSLWRSNLCSDLPQGATRHTRGRRRSPRAISSKGQMIKEQTSTETLAKTIKDRWVEADSSSPLSLAPIFLPHSTV